MSNDRVMTDPSEKARALAEKAAPDSVMGMDEDESGGHCAACVIEGQAKHCNQPAAFLALRSAVPDLLDRLALLEGIVRDLAAVDRVVHEHRDGAGRDHCAVCVSDGGFGSDVYHVPECPYRRAVAAIARVKGAKRQRLDEIDRHLDAIERGEVSQAVASHVGHGHVIVRVEKAHGH